MRGIINHIMGNEVNYERQWGNVVGGCGGGGSMSDGVVDMA